MESAGFIRPLKMFEFKLLTHLCDLEAYIVCIGRDYLRCHWQTFLAQQISLVVHINFCSYAKLINLLVCVL